MKSVRTKMIGPTVVACDQVHAMKYRQSGETFRDAINRVANALKDNDQHFHKFREIVGDMRFLPAGRVQTAMGSAKKVTAFNCYVAPTIDDSYIYDLTTGEIGGNSIMGVATQAAATMRMGGGIGYDFSTLRPKKALIKGLDSLSSGPVSFMKIYDQVCQATASTGHRRGAQMGVLRIDHPDILEFITAKHDNTTLTGFNMSVGVTDEFMDAVVRGGTYKLKFNGETFKELDARETYEMLMRSTWDYAEPGILFIDRINEQNNLYYCEQIAATNPCGEQPLPPNGACLLGSFNLVRYLTAQENGKYSFDWHQFEADIEPVVRAMDNVIDRTNYPLEAQEGEAKAKRRMGLGVTGLANAGEAMGLAYGTAWFVEFESRVLGLLANKSYQSSAILAGEKGSFPLYDADRYLAGKYVSRLDQETIELIKRHGIRNSHLTSIAPTGTISFTADNISSGIEPIYKFKSKRTINTPDGQMLVDVFDYGFARLGVRGRRSGMGEVGVQEHLKVLLTAQKWVDSAVSKTCNTDGSIEWADFKNLYLNAWHGGAKGLTTFNKDGKRAGLYKDEPESNNIPFPTGEDQTLLPGINVQSFVLNEEQEALPLFMEGCNYDPATGRRECA